jgi:hypothetical protein
MSFVKDTRSGVVINTDDTQYKAILAARQAQKEKNEICSKMESLSNELNDIKLLLQQVLNRNQ